MIGFPHELYLVIMQARYRFYCRNFDFVLFWTPMQYHWILCTLTVKILASSDLSCDDSKFKRIILRWFWIKAHDLVIILSSCALSCVKCEYTRIILCFVCLKDSHPHWNYQSQNKQSGGLLVIVVGVSGLSRCRNHNFYMASQKKVTTRLSWPCFYKGCFCLFILDNNNSP